MALATKLISCLLDMVILRVRACFPGPADAYWISQHFNYTMAILERISAFTRRHAMFTETRGVVIAVSGGADSVAMLDVLIRLFGERQAGDPRLHVAHINHLLRGRESAEDAEFVRVLADRLGLPATIGSADVAEAARRTRRGIEETARELRYKFLLETALATDADRIAIGHTADDQAETLLLRLVRGAATSGLAAMRAVSPAHVFDLSDVTASGSQRSVKIVRPILCLTRHEVEDYCRDRGLAFRIDRTNLDETYARNKLRRRVIPVLRELNPEVARALSRAAEIIASDRDALDEITLAAFERCQTTEGLSVACLLQQPPAIRNRVLIEAVKRQPNPPQLTSSHVEALLGLLGQAARGRRVELPGGLVAWREFDQITLMRRGRCERYYEIEILSGQKCIFAGGFEIELTRGVPSSQFGSLLEGIRADRDRGSREWLEAVLDGDAVPDRLVIRPRRPGETAWVVGQSGSKKLKNLMIDHRIPTSRRATWPIVTTLDGRYIWSPGLPPATQFAACAESSGLVILRARGRSTEERYATEDTRGKVRTGDRETHHHAGGGDSCQHSLR